MIEQPSLTDAKAQIAAVIHLSIPRARIQVEMPPAIQEVMAAVALQGLRPTGPLFSHHLMMSPDIFDFEVGVPVSARISPTGRVRLGELPAARVARTVYHGPYEGLHEAWQEFDTRLRSELGRIMTEEGLAPADSLWECYVSGPESNPDPATWRTELNRPLRRAVP